MHVKTNTLLILKLVLRLQPKSSAFLIYYNTIWPNLITEAAQIEAYVAYWQENAIKSLHFFKKFLFLFFQID